MEAPTVQSSCKTFNKSFQFDNNDFEFSMSSQKDSLKFEIKNLSTFQIYVSSFNFESLKKHKILNANNNIEEIFEFLKNKIEKNNLQIKNEKKILVITIITFEYSTIELEISEKEQTPAEITHFLKKEIFKLRNDVNVLKKNNISNFSKYYFIICSICILLLSFFTKTKSEKPLNSTHNSIDNDFLNKIKNDIFNDQKIQLVKVNFKLKKELKDSNFNLISLFPTKNYAITKRNGDILIFDEVNNTTLQEINKAHDNKITYLSMKDDNNFVSCSDTHIKFWTKSKNSFINSNSIFAAHKDLIYNVIFYMDNKIISCSNDTNIKIWEFNNNPQTYSLIKTFKNKKEVTSILLLEDLDILVSCGLEGTKFWDLKKDKVIGEFYEVICFGVHSIERINYDNIVVVGININIINIFNKVIIKELKCEFLSYSILSLENKGIFLVGGNSNHFNVYRSDNYEKIGKVHFFNQFLIRFSKMRNNVIASFHDNDTINFWEF